MGSLVAYEKSYYLYYRCFLALSPSLPLSFPFLLGDVSHRPSPGGLLQTLTHRRNDNRRRPRIDRIARNHRHVPDVVLLSICANVPFVFYEYLYSSLDDSCEFFPILTNKRRPLFYFFLFFFLSFLRDKSFSKLASRRMECFLAFREN